MALVLRSWLRLTAILCFSLLLVKSALAAQITAEPAQGPAGMIVTVRGTEWTPGHSIEFSWNFNYYLMVASILADANGAFAVPIRVPSGAPLGLTYIDAGDQATFQTAQAPFTINSAFTGSDDYPEPLCPLNPSSGWPANEFVDPWDFYNRECTSFVTWRLNQNNGFPAAFANNRLGTRFGNAYEWVHPDSGQSAVEILEIRTDNIPLPGDVAWFDKWTAGATSNGHVAWVQSVNPDGSIVLEDYNFAGTGLYDQRPILASEVSQLRFIHFSDWFNTRLQSNNNRQPPSILTAPNDPELTFRDGVLVYFRIFFTDPDHDAIGFGFRGIKGSGWAEETHPFALPSYGQLVGSRPEGNPLKSQRIAIQYPFNHSCGTRDAYESDVEAWIYDRDGRRSTPLQIHLACAARGTPHFLNACTRD